MNTNKHTLKVGLLSLRNDLKLSAEKGDKLSPRQLEEYKEMQRMLKELQAKQQPAKAEPTTPKKDGKVEMSAEELASGKKCPIREFTRSQIKRL
jgi:hypothetical protein